MKIILSLLLSLALAATAAAQTQPEKVVYHIDNTATQATKGSHCRQSAGQT